MSLNRVSRDWTSEECWWVTSCSPPANEIAFEKVELKMPDSAGFSAVAAPAEPATSCECVAIQPLTVQQE